MSNAHQIWIHHQNDEQTFFSSLVEFHNDHYDNLRLTKMSVINGFFFVHTLYNDHPSENTINLLNVIGLSIISRGKFTKKMLKNDIKKSFRSYFCLYREISRKYDYFKYRSQRMVTSKPYAWTFNSKNNCSMELFLFSIRCNKNIDFE